MNDSWRRGFDAARQGARLAQAPRHSRKVGAALYSGPRLLSIGFNSYAQTHPNDHRGYSLHAEHRAVLRRQYFSSPRRQTLYVWRETADGKPANCTPCVNCLRIMREAGIGTVRYINDKGKETERDIS